MLTTERLNWSENYICKNLGGEDFGECLVEGGVLSKLTVYRNQ